MGKNKPRATLLSENKTKQEFKKTKEWQNKNQHHNAKIILLVHYLSLNWKQFMWMIKMTDCYQWL